MYVKKQTKKGINYYSLVESNRVEGEKHPVQTLLESLGTYYEALDAVDRSEKIKESQKQRFLSRLASLEGVLLEVQIKPKVYQTIVIDAPWHKMDVDSIIDLPIVEISDRKGCVLWLWLTNDKVLEAARCVRTWGYKLQTMLTWEKVTENGLESIEYGEWLNDSTEHCLIATKGYVASFSEISTLGHQSTLLIAKRRQRGLKPDEFYRLVETLQPTAVRIVMFRRLPRKGWDTWIPIG